MHLHHQSPLFPLQQFRFRCHKLIFCYKTRRRNVHGIASNQHARVPAGHKPIQLLRPPVFCKLVCPIFTTPAPAGADGDAMDSCLDELLLRRGDDVSGFPPQSVSIASTSGLGIATGVEGTARKEPLPLMSDAGDVDLRSRGVLSPPDSEGEDTSAYALAFETGRNDSANHSYHT